MSNSDSTEAATAWERQQLDEMRADLNSVWTNEVTGAESPFIKGVTFTSIDLRDEHPRTSVVALFVVDGQPDRTFGAAWNLYDESGARNDLSEAALGLNEDIASRGVPTADDVGPDADGIEWYEPFRSSPRTEAGSLPHGDPGGKSVGMGIYRSRDRPDARRREQP